MPDDAAKPSGVGSSDQAKARQGAKAIFGAPRERLWVIRFAVVFLLFMLGLFLSVPLWAPEANALAVQAIGVVVIVPLALLGCWEARKMKDHVEVDGATITHVSARRGARTLRWEEVTEIRERFGWLELLTGDGCLELLAGDAARKPMRVWVVHYPRRADLALAVYSCFRAARGESAANPKLPASFRPRGVLLAVMILSLLALAGGYVVCTGGGSIGWLGIIAGGWWLVALCVGTALMIPVKITVDQGGLLVTRVVKRSLYPFERIAFVGLGERQVQIAVPGRRFSRGSVDLGCAREGTLLMYYTILSAWQAWKESRP
ncbi:MAG: hypothetical protein FJ291_03935 [Planctomycetes bacterium]|nr:hypothetical protein [Planctomycetota bacterium]